MTNIKTLYFLIFLLMLGTAGNAQTKKKNTVRNARQAKAEPNQADILYENMLSSTACVTFIDSMVTDKKDFLNAVMLSRESGSLNTYNSFWNTEEQPSAYTYINEFGNKLLFSKTGSDGHSRLFTSDKLNGQWSAPKQINDFGDDFEDINCPFMMSDGVTLYFAAKGKSGIGGYDIYVTMYDTDSARFYKPENIGLPYNSRGNDYYCVTDEFNSLGWLVTDRNQPEGKVCVYTFIPSDSRKTYREDETGEDKLRRLASISSIRDTWTDKNAVQAALERLSAAKKRSSATSGDAMSFYINDNIVYSNTNDFRLPINRQRYKKLTSMQADKARLDSQLETQRQQYSTSTASARRRMAPAILKLERQCAQLDSQISRLEKEIRNTENIAINQ